MHAHALYPIWVRRLPSKLSQDTAQKYFVNLPNSAERHAELQTAQHRGFFARPFEKPQRWKVAHLKLGGNRLTSVKQPTEELVK